MKRSKFSLLIYFIFGLAIIGLGSQLLTNSIPFLLKIMLTIGITAVLFAGIYFLFVRSTFSSPEMKKYRKAVKQSKRKYKQNKHFTSKQTTNRNRPSPLKKGTATRAAHLKVIDGNKAKRKKRASN